MTSKNAKFHKFTKFCSFQGAETPIAKSQIPQISGFKW